MMVGREDSTKQPLTSAKEDLDQQIDTLLDNVIKLADELDGKRKAQMLERLLSDGALAQDATRSSRTTLSVRNHLDHSERGGRMALEKRVDAGNFTMPRLPLFSGQEGSDTSFTRFKVEVSTLRRSYTDEVVLEAIRRCLRSPAADVWMRASGSITQLMSK